MTVTRASIALADLIATMTKLDELSGRLPYSEKTDALISQLEDRRTSLERQLVAEVKDKLGVDYGVLWMAVTPTET